MVYLAGDNDLEQFGVKDLHEMKAIGSTGKVSVVAQFDSMADRVTRRYYLTHGGSLDTDCVTVLPEVNTGDPAALVDFITWARRTYPAHHYALVLWNHGSGWKDDDIYRAATAEGIRLPVARGQMRGLTAGKPSRALFSSTLQELVLGATERAILFDDSAADFLDNLELKRVLQTVALTLEGQLDLLGFDACLMSMLEVQYQLKGLCQVMVGSQEVEPGDGWPYHDLLAQLAADPDLTPEELGRVIVDTYVRFYQAQFPELPVTQAAVRSAAIDPVAVAVGVLGRTLLEHLEDRQTLGALFGALRLAQSFSDRDYVDLAHFCQILANDKGNNPVRAAAQEVADLLSDKNSLVIAEAHHGPGVSRATGLSIYLPTRTLSPLYSRLDFAREKEWDEFLSAFVGPQ